GALIQAALTRFASKLRYPSPVNGRRSSALQRRRSSLAGERWMRRLGSAKQAVVGVGRGALPLAQDPLRRLLRVETRRIVDRQHVGVDVDHQLELGAGEHDRLGS